MFVDHMAQKKITQSDEADLSTDLFFTFELYVHVTGKVLGFCFGVFRFV